MNKLAQIPSPAKNCNARRRNRKELNKHLQYRCHLAINGEQLYEIQIGDMYINRKRTRNMFTELRRIYICNKNMAM